MRHALRIGFLLLCAIAFAGAAPAQTVYKSVGPDGHVVYSDRAPTSGHLEKTMKFADLPSSALPATTASYMEEFRRTHPAGEDAAAPSPSVNGVVLYSAAWCGYCRKAKAWLGAKGVAYQDVDIDTPSGMAAFAQATGGGGGIPVLVAKGRKVKGFSAGAYDAIFASPN